MGDWLRRRVRELLIVLLALATVATWPATQQPIMGIAFVRYVVAALVLGLMAVEVFYRRPRVDVRWLGPPVLILVWSAVSLLRDRPDLSTILDSQWPSLLQNVVWFLLATTWLIQDRDPVRSFECLIVLPALILLAEGVYCLLFVDSFGVFGLRNAGFVGNPNAFAYLVVVTAPFLWNRRWSVSTIAFIVIVAIEAVIVASTGSRGGILAFSLALLIICIKSLLRRTYWRAAGASLGVALMLGFVVGPQDWPQVWRDVPIPVKEGQVESRPTEKDRFVRHQVDNVDRYTLTVAGLLAMRDQPVFGAGITEMGRAIEHKVRYLRPDLEIAPFGPSSTSHGVLPTLGAAMGLPGFLLGAWWLFLLIGTYARAERMRREEQADYAPIALLIAVFYWLFEDKFFFGSGVLGVYFWTLAAAFTAADMIRSDIAT